jgi:hypothetical protein
MGYSIRSEESILVLHRWPSTSEQAQSTLLRCGHSPCRLLGEFTPCTEHRVCIPSTEYTPDEAGDKFVRTHKKATFKTYFLPPQAHFWPFFRNNFSSCPNLYKDYYIKRTTSQTFPVLRNSGGNHLELCHSPSIIHQRLQTRLHTLFRPNYIVVDCFEGDCGPIIKNCPPVGIIYLRTIVFLNALFLHAPDILHGGYIRRRRGI